MVRVVMRAGTGAPQAISGIQRRGKVRSDRPPETVPVTLQHARTQPLVRAGDVVHVAVGAMVYREVETKLALPPAPEVLQDAVSREVVEEPVEAKVRIDAGREVIGLSGPV